MHIYDKKIKVQALRSLFLQNTRMHAQNSFEFTFCAFLYTIISIVLTQKKSLILLTFLLPNGLFTFYFLLIELLNYVLSMYSIIFTRFDESMYNLIEISLFKIDVIFPLMEKI